MMTGNMIVHTVTDDTTCFCMSVQSKPMYIPYMHAQYICRVTDGTACSILVNTIFTVNVKISGVFSENAPLQSYDTCIIVSQPVQTAIFSSTHKTSKHIMFESVYA